jgi:hypothetical protein
VRIRPPKATYRKAVLVQVVDATPSGGLAEGKKPATGKPVFQELKSYSKTAYRCN